MVKKQRKKTRKPAPARHLSVGWHPLLVAAAAAFVCLLPWPEGGWTELPWLRTVGGVVVSVLYYFLCRWILRASWPALAASLLLSSFVAVWMPFRLEWMPWVILFPLSTVLSALMNTWERKLSGKASRGGLNVVLFGATAGMLSLGVICLSALVCLAPVRLGSLPMLSGLLIAAVALGVVLLAVSAFVRRAPWDLLLGAVLYAFVWKLLAFPGFESFL